MKLAVIVVDCAEHTIIERLLAEGEMPTLSGLRKRGLTVPLRSDGDTLDGSVFQTFLTGTNPGQHGIYKYHELAPGTYDYRLSKASLSPVPQIWSVLSGRGRTCCVFDPPKAFPIDGFQGKLVASWGSYTPAGDPASTPPDLLPEILRQFGPHPKRNQDPVPVSPERYLAVLELLKKAARRRVDICRWLLRDGGWEFFLTCFSESHVASHQYWHLRDGSHPLFDPSAAAVCGDALEQLYLSIDAQVARLVQVFPDDATVVVLTQQGVQNNFTGSHLLPQWLALREGRSPKPSWLVKFAPRFGSPLRYFIHRHLPEAVINHLTRRKFPATGRVFMLAGSEYGALLRVNLQGREPAGTVPPSDYRSTLDQLREDLLQVRNPATGEQAVSRVRFLHDEHHGQCVEHLPDVLVSWRNDRPITELDCPRHGLLTGGLRFTDVTHSMHTSEGLAFIAGPNVPHGEINERHDIMDLHATFFRLLGETVPEHVEGRAIDLARVTVALRG
jgi:predicted AlkP superfamily phosphohydrolase/phosphomutase